MKIESGPTRLLVVDDVEMNRDMLSRRLRKQGHEVEMVEGGVEALAMLEASSFDLVLLDVMMPGMDGYEVLARIKSSETLRHIPVIMISALDETDSIVKCIELGAEDYLPKPFNPVLLKARIGASLDKKKLRDRERMYAEMMERELEIGRKIQQGFLPETIPQPEGWEFAARFEPARQVAGDFYDLFLFDNGQVGIVVADVCDKGVGAALYMALFRTLIRAVSTEALPSGEDRRAILERTISLTNDYIATTHGRANMFATVFFAALDPATGELDYVNGGHESPLIVRGGEVIERLAPTGPAVGLMPEMPFGTNRTRLEPGDMLVAYTDGLIEAQGVAGLFGDDRVLDLLRQEPKSAGALLDLLEKAVKLHEGDFDPSDDLTLVCLARMYLSIPTAHQVPSLEA